MAYEMETAFKVWDNESGAHYEVCHDADGLGLIEIRNVNSDGEIAERLSIAPEAAALVADAILKLELSIKNGTEGQSGFAPGVRDPAFRQIGE